MNKRIEEVLNNPKATPQDFFELVNVFDLSELYIQGDDNTTVMSMMVNRFENFHNSVSIEQRCTNTQYTISNEDVKTVTGKMVEDSDTLLISIEMKDGSFVYLCIYHTDTNIKAEIQGDYQESDVISLFDYLNELDKYTADVTISDSFGIELNIFSATVSMKENREEYCFDLSVSTHAGTGARILSFSEGMGTGFCIPLVDDSCNEVFFKRGEHVDCIMIKPYGQPFMEIRIVVAKEK
jgi:hypothetical protein